MFDFDALTKAMAEKFKRYVDNRLNKSERELSERILLLEERYKNLKDDIVKDKKEQFNLSIETEFDFSKSYKAGTFVLYKSGLVFAEKDTIPLDDIEDSDEGFDKILKSGFCVLVNGLDSIDIDFDEDNRELKVKTCLTDLNTTKKIDLPLVYDKGVYTDDKTYKKFDAVTHQGSLWIAQRDTKEGEKPGLCDAFRLSVKRGK